MVLLFMKYDDRLLDIYFKALFSSIYSWFFSEKRNIAYLKVDCFSSFSIIIKINDVMMLSYTNNNN